MIKAKNLSVGYKNHPVLSGVELEIKKGSLTVLLGRNGSGKSTLLSALAGVKRSEGEIFLCADPITSFDPKSRAKKLSYLPQLLPAPGLLVRELVALGRSPHLGLTGRMSDADRQKAELAMERVGISMLGDKRADRISGGELRLAYLAMVLAQDTDVLLLDEPAAHMDASNARELYNLLVSLTQNEGKTVAVSTHDLSSALEIAGEVIILDGGIIAFAGSREECLERGAIEEIFNVTRYRDKDKEWFC